MRRMLILGVISLSTSVQAEVPRWQSNYGDVIYEADFGEIAVLSFSGPHPSHRVHMYIEGLGSNHDKRDVFSGYWIAPAQSDCPTKMSGEDGLTSNTWGSVEITFDNASSPSSFIARLENCFGKGMEAMRAITQHDVAAP